MDIISEILELERQMYEIVAKAEEVEGSDSKALAQALINFEQGSMWFKRSVMSNRSVFGGNNG